MYEREIAGFLRSNVLSLVPDAWCGATTVKIGCEISFARHFYKPGPNATISCNLGGHQGAGSRGLRAD